MDDWIEEDLTLQAEASAEKTSRVLDQHVIREPIRILQPRTPLSLPPSATVADAVRMMREHRVGCLLVVASDRLVGIITERDLLLKLEQGDLDRPVSHLMTPDPEVLGLADPIAYALNKMSVGGFRHRDFACDRFARQRNRAALFRVRFALLAATLRATPLTGAPGGIVRSVCR